MDTYQDIEKFWEDDNKKVSIRIAGNTAHKCLIAVHKKGYEVQYYCEERKADNGEVSYLHCYGAKKDHRYFSATTPEELLGLIALWEVKGDDWREVSEEERKWYQDLEERSRIFDENGKDVTDE